MACQPTMSMMLTSLSMQGCLSPSSRHLKGIWRWAYTEARGGVPLDLFLVSGKLPLASLLGLLLSCQRIFQTAWASPSFHGKRMCAQALETEEARAARNKRVAEALSSYKRKAGLLVDPVAEAAAQEAFMQGQELMRKVRGASAAAYAHLHYLQNFAICYNP